MQIAFGKTVISPEIGTRVAGYGPYDYSVAKLDDLYATALALDDGHRKCVIISYDLLGIDEAYVKRIREACAECLGGEAAQVILTCTHTHGGPHTRTLANRPDSLEREYNEELIRKTAALVQSVVAGQWVHTSVYFYSRQCDANLNRRFVSNSNQCSFLPNRRDVERIADGFIDQEAGVLFFVDDAGQVVYVIGNYAAHPLASHCPGIGGHRISADYPGAFRRYIEREVGAGCMFTEGACGDMVPKGHELGSAASEAIGVQLAQAVIDGIIDATRRPASFKLQNETLQCGFAYTSAAVRPFRKGHMPIHYEGKDTLDFEVQALSIGDICLVGVPGEMVAELGQEIKWHSPFRKTFILYCSTAYMDYLCHGNALVSGGYEGHEQYTEGRTGLKLVNAAVDCAYELYGRTFPDRSQWAENTDRPLVALHDLGE